MSSTGASGVLSVNDEIASGDEIVWDGGIGFSLQFADGSLQIYEESKIQSRLKAECEPKRMGINLAFVIGWVRSFILEGSRFEITIDKVVKIGEVRTAFELEIDSSKGLVGMRVARGRLRLDGPLGGLAVDAFEEAMISYTSVPTGRKIGLEELHNMKIAFLSSARLYGVYQDPVVDSSLDSIQREINRRELNPTKWASGVKSYVIQPGDTVNSIILKFYPVRDAHKNEALRAISNEIVRTNPQVSDPDRIQPGVEVKLPAVPVPTIRKR